jgi:DNA-binding CsgD family transcriptional regulator
MPGISRNIRQMTDARDSSLTRRDRAVVSVVLVSFGGLMVADVAGDWASGSTAMHIGVELLLAVLAAGGLAWLWADDFRQRHRAVAMRGALERARTDATVWRERHAAVLHGLAQAIDQQLDAWTLTPVEKEVAMLLLKGLSFKEIAAVRGTSERTVRQQAGAVYAKSGLTGRAELAAFFLEDLLVESPLAGRDPG